MSQPTPRSLYPKRDKKPVVRFSFDRYGKVEESFTTQSRHNIDKITLRKITKKLKSKNSVRNLDKKAHSSAVKTKDDLDDVYNLQGLMSTDDAVIYIRQDNTTEDSTFTSVVTGSTTTVSSVLVDPKLFTDHGKNISLSSTSDTAVSLTDTVVTTADTLTFL